LRACDVVLNSRVDRLQLQHAAWREGVATMVEVRAS
jgi:hypothetical protein